MRKKLNLNDIQEFPAYIVNKDLPLIEIEIFGCVDIVKDLSIVSFQVNRYYTLGIKDIVLYQYKSKFEDNFKNWEIRSE